MTAIEKDIKKIIEDITEREYVSRLIVTQDDDIWTLYLFLDKEFGPLVMSIQGDERKFKRFVAKEMKRRRLQEVKYWKVDRTLPALECNENGELELGW